MKLNHLKNETSPYLLQHSKNPVDWYPYNESVFEMAKKMDKPVFLSIGYSSCHWCHVMAEESFEDEEIADILNRDFISIKVDKEEKPDIDHFYMSVCQIMNGSGGWPLTVILTPEKYPVFSGTYFPKKSGFGRIGLIDILTKLSEIWGNSKEEIIESAKNIKNSIINILENKSKDRLNELNLDMVYSKLISDYDPIYGGFGSIPKFPMPHYSLFLMNYYNFKSEAKSIEIVGQTLDKMHAGGIYDHIGGGFHRYATDKKWNIPHFEKMLYDQALISKAFLEYYKLNKDEKYLNISKEILDYTISELQSEEGGFYTSEDADSEGEEGRFYLWQYEELGNILENDEFLLLKEYFNLTKEGNFKEGPLGSNILYINQDKSKSLFSDYQKYFEIISIKNKIKSYRDKRTHPLKDTKILTDWNGLMIASLSFGARYLNENKYKEAAEKALRYLLKQNFTENGLIHYSDKDTRISGYLDDYAFFIYSLLENYKLTFHSENLKIAAILLNISITKFWDEEKGVFYFSQVNNNELDFRQIIGYDNAVPSGNSVMVSNLIEFFNISGDIKYFDFASRILRYFSNSILNNPGAYIYMMTGYFQLLNNPMKIVIVDKEYSDNTEKLIKKCYTESNKNCIILFNSINDPNYNISRQFKIYENYSILDNKPTIYLCKNNECYPPLFDFQSLQKLIE